MNGSADKPRAPWSRRKFVATAGTTAVAAASGVTVFSLLGSDQAVRYFDVNHDQDVYVTMTNGREFVVEVKRRSTREVLEHHEGVTRYNLLSLESDYVSITAAA